MSRDPHRFSNELEDDAIHRLIARLENRAKDAVFTNLVGKFIERLELSGEFRLLEVGCGTGAVVRSVARRKGMLGEVIGVDQCEAFVAAAKRFADAENVGDRVDFHVGDAHDLVFPSASFDVVIASTLISHVTEPQAVLREMARVLRPDGTIVIFDGDYASLTYAYADHAFGRRMDDAMAHATFNNPMIMRDLPSLLPTLGLGLKAAWGDAVVEVGKASFFQSFAETYVPYVLDAGGLPKDAVEKWHEAQIEASASGTFFGSCNYYTYLIGRNAA